MYTLALDTVGISGILWPISTLPLWWQINSQFWALGYTEVLPLLTIASTCPHGYILFLLFPLLVVCFFFFPQGKRKGTKLAYRICESIITDWNMLICRLFHKQKNPKIGLLLLCMSPFLCTLSIKAWSNTAAYSWVDGISTINTISTISLPSWTFSFCCIFG